MLPEGAYWLAWSQISGVGPVLIRRLQQHFGTLEAAWKASQAQLGEVEGFGLQILKKVLEQRSRLHPQQLFSKHQQENPYFWTPADTDYPRLLLETPSPPPVLYYRGEVELSENWGKKSLVGIVGTRKPSDYGLRWTRKISTTLAKNGFTVVSGLAEGIDTVSHSGAMDGGGRTIAVLGTGVDVVYPAKNQDLYKRILIQKQGLIISEYASKTPPQSYPFSSAQSDYCGIKSGSISDGSTVKIRRFDYG